MDTSSSPVFFCHQCSQELDTVTAEFTCPRCHSGFIEELQEPLGRTRRPGAAEDFGEEDEDEEDPHQHMGDEGPYIPGDQLLEHILGPMLFGVARGAGGGDAGAGAAGLPAAMGGRVNVGPGRGGSAGGARLGVGAGNMAGPLMLQELLANLTGQPMGGGAGMHSFVVPGGGAGMQMYGNPGDYAWGRGGLDAVVTQLLNQFDGAGPAPLKTEFIKEIPSVDITSDHINSKMQCSVCWEDFQLGESVRRLHCDHFFHDPCIVPWLKLHSTCPVCRKSQEPEGGAVRSEGEVSGGSGPQGNEAAAPAGGEQQEAATTMGNAMTYVFNLLGYNGESAGASAPSSSSSSVPSTSSSSSSSSSSQSTRPTTAAAASRPPPSSSATSASQGEPMSRRARDDGEEGGGSYEDFDLE